MITKLRTILMPAAVFLSLSHQAQFNNDYQPIKKADSIPAIFFMDPVEATRINVENSTLLTKKEAEEFYGKMNYYKSQLFLSGELYLPNRLTHYLDSITQKLLVTEPKLKNNIKIYLTRFTQANAFCFPDGSIFVNIGLLAALQNEAELAFVLSHEIAHFAEEHNVKDIKRLARIQAEESYFNQNSSLFRSLKFSREAELEADAWALDLIGYAGYDPALASGALQKLKSRESSAEQVDLKKHFETSELYLDTNWYSEKAVRRNKSHFNKNGADPIATGKLNDLFETHPDVEKRTEALSLIAKNAKKKESLNPVNNSVFQQVHEIAIFECIENNYREQDYLNSVIGALQAHETYPQNVYLHAAVSRSLYWLNYFKEISESEINVSGDKEENGDDFLRLYALFSEMSLKDTKKMAYLYSLQKYEKHTDSETALFYLAVNTENYLGKIAAKTFYRDYLVKHPGGAYTPYINKKLQ